ncbi:hypothetical protein P9112_014089 [Eukaryota sp. TZLM1-RC]
MTPLNRSFSFAIKAQSKELELLDQRIKHCTSNISKLQRSQEKFLNTLSPVKRATKATKATSRISSPLPPSPVKSRHIPEVSEYLNRLRPDGTVLPRRSSLPLPHHIQILSQDIVSRLHQLKHQRLEEMVSYHINKSLTQKSKIKSFLTIRSKNFKITSGPNSFINPQPFCDNLLVPPCCSKLKNDMVSVEKVLDFNTFVLNAAQVNAEKASNRRKEMIKESRIIQREFTVLEAVKVVENYWILYKRRRRNRNRKVEINDKNLNMSGGVTPILQAKVDPNLDGFLSTQDLEAYLSKFPLKPSYNDVLACLSKIYPKYFKYIPPSSKEFSTPQPFIEEPCDNSDVSTKSKSRHQSRNLGSQKLPFWSNPHQLSSLAGSHRVDMELNWILDVLHSKSKNNLSED